MNTKACFSSAVIFLFPIFASAQDTVNAVPTGHAANAVSIVDTAKPAEDLHSNATKPDTVSLADSGHPYTIVVTATRREQPSEWVSDDHSVIDVDNLRQSTSKSVTELLSTHVPARFSDYGGGGLKTISLRGAGSERTLLLVNGRRTGTDDDDVGDIPPEIIQKIEVVEGGQSALYGMDAVGGVVNIITKQPPPEKPFGTLSTTLSSFEPNADRLHLNTMEHNFTTGMTSGRIQWLGGANWQSSDGRYTYRDLNGTYQLRENNGFTNWGIYQRLGYDRNGVALDVSASYSDHDIGSPGTVESPIRATTRKKSGVLAAEGSWEINKLLKLKLNASYERDSIHYIDPDTHYLMSGNVIYDSIVPQNSRHVWDRGDVQCIQEFTLDKQLLNTGMQFIRQAVESNEIGSHNMEQGGVFANGILEQSFADFVIRETPALRYDYSSIYNGTLNGRFGAIGILQVPFEPSMFVNFGSSYRSPPFDYLYWPQDAFAVGNPDLKPERGIDFDGGAQCRYDIGKTRITARASFFYMKLSDMMIWQPRGSDSTDMVWTIKNIEKASIKGAKVNMSFRYLKAWDGSFDFVYNNARNLNSKTVLIYRPKYIGTFSSQWSGSRLTAGISCRFTGRVYTDELNTDSLPSTLTFDANIGYKILALGPRDEGVRVVYDILNITNEKLSTNEGYPLPGREHRVSLKMNF
jgi:vitamin B12 transporter